LVGGIVGFDDNWIDGKLELLQDHMAQHMFPLSGLHME
jgi:hypothetical protein